LSTKKVFTIAVLPGDGVGLEVTGEAVRILRAIASGWKECSLHFVEESVGAGEFLRSGDPLPARAFSVCGESDAVLLGAMGLPNVRWPDGRELTPQIDLRERLDLYCGLRPIRLYHANDTPLKNLGAGDIDMMLVRENTEGLFSARLSQSAGDGSEATDVLRITRHGAERIVQKAFQQAKKRRGKVTLVDKANVLPSMVFFRRIFDEISEQYPEIESERIYVDAAALYLIRRPGDFDVLVTENMFGDILSDMTAGLVGGMGMAPSADLGDRYGVFQPSHGTAPDIAGKGIANPVATILSAAMLLEWLDHPEAKKGAGLVFTAVERVLSDPQCRTPDMGGKLRTPEMTDRILRELEQA
jgi:3-isopropylmalate dehydrogenase